MIRIGHKFQEQRLKKGLTIGEVAKATRIRESFLLAIEKGEYEKLPSSTYAQGFVRNYAEFLEMPVSETLALFRREFNEEKIYKVLPEGFSSSQEFPLKRNGIQNTIKIIIAAFVILLAYIFLQYRYAFMAPSLEIITPKEGQIVTTQNVVVEGKTDPNATVFVDNDPASVDNNGNFSKTIASFTGETTITVKVINNFGKQQILQRHIEIK